MDIKRGYRFFNINYMKKIFYSLLFVLPLWCAAQTETPKTEEVFIYYNKIKAKPGEMYVDDVKYDPQKTFLDPSNFGTVKVIKADADKANKKAKGATFITRKSKPKLFTLNSIIKQIQEENEKLKDAKKVNIVINGISVKDTEGYMIEKSTIVRTEVKDTDKKGTVPTIEITTKNRRK